MPSGILCDITAGVFATCDVTALEQPNPPWLTVHGESGALLSRGLLERLDYAAFEDCVKTTDFGACAVQRQQQQHVLDLHDWINKKELPWVRHG